MGALGVRLASENTKLSPEAQARCSMMQEAVNRALGRASDPDHQRGAFQLVVSGLVKQVAQSHCACHRSAEVSHPSRSASGKNPSQRDIFVPCGRPG